MAAGRQDHDYLAAFRLRMVRVASLIAWITLGAAGFYVLFHAGHHVPVAHEIVWVVLLLAAALSLAIDYRSRRWANRVPLAGWVFYVWTAVLLAFDSLVVALSGDASSDIYLIYLPAVLFAAGTLATWGALLALVAALASYLGILLAVDPGITHADLVMRSATFAVVSLLGGYLAREQQHELAARIAQEHRLRERGRELEAERERAQALAAEMQTMLDILAEGVVAVDAGGRIVFINAAAERLLGWPNEAVEDRPCAEVLDALDDAGHPVAWEQSAVGRGEAEGGVRLAIRPREGERIVCDVNGAVRRNGGARVVGYLYTLRDIRQEEQQRQEILRQNQRLSQLLAKVISAQEGERKRIARELHDGPVQALAAISMQLGMIEEMASTDYAQSQSRLARLRAELRCTLDEIRLMMQNLRPSALDDLGLVTALREFTTAQLDAAGIQLRWQVSGHPRRLPAPVETAVFRILQEGVNNVVRHSQAHRARVALRFSGGHLCASLRDDGVGFDSEQVRHHPDDGCGLGLLGMQERASLLGGCVVVTSAPGRGTRVRADIPLEVAADG